MGSQFVKKNSKNCQKLQKYLPNRNTYPTEILTQQKYLPNRNTYLTEILTQQKYLPNRNTYPTEILTQQKYLPNRDIVELGNDRIELMLTYINICLC